MREKGSRVAPEAADPLAEINFVGSAPCFRQAIETIKRISDNDATVLIKGETGTGKELAARALHYYSCRRSGPFIPVNCAALPEGLIESELFGHERGAFTDAKHAFEGVVAQAEGGTLFLDEIDAVSPRAQAVLLRFLQDRAYRPVGGRATVSGDLRILASTNADLSALVERGAFRHDLLFRLDILGVTMPPLRARGDDVLLLARHFLRRFAVHYKRPEVRLADDCATWMMSHHWPGNVRELENLVLRRFLLSEGDTLGLSEDSPGSPQRHGGGDTSFDAHYRTAKARALAAFELGYLRQLLIRSQGNISLAARMSLKDRSALNKLVRKHGLAEHASRLRSS